ncbi:MAG: XTP/dITP diphosphatase [bacterium]
MSSSLRLVLATRNAGKIREIRAILARLPVELVTLESLPEAGSAREDGLTFEDNAAKKALHVWRATGLAALADDSGLEVDALGGRPGILSARFAGESATHAENNRKLLDLLAGVPPGRRRARFVCVAALARPGGELVLTRGEVEGVISDAPAGTGGFGYDPVFYLPAYGKTIAELDEAVKNGISHRAAALRAMAPAIEALAGNQ